MAAKKYISLANGELLEIQATVVSAGAGDDGDLVALDTTGRLDLSVMPVGIGPDTKSLVTSENLSAGDLVNVYDNASVATARKADASNGYEAHGFVLASSTSPAAAIVYFEGIVTGLSGLTPGATQFLSATAGEVTETPVTTSGYISQRAGVAIAATEMSFEPSRKVTLA